MAEQPSLEKYLKRLRPLCLRHAESDEKLMFGNPTFRVKSRMFAVVGIEKGAPCLVVKVGHQAMGLFLEDPRYFRAPYLGQHGWVALRLNTKLNWEEIGELVDGSYQLVKQSLKGKRK